MRIKDYVSRYLKNVVAAVLLLGFAIGATAQSNLPPTFVYARAYGQWSIQGQQANTFTFNGGVCNFSPYNDGNTPSFFVFSGYIGSTLVYNPVLISDMGASTNNEIVTPTSTTQSSSSCGFAASTSHSHTSFTLTSGTAGLQEAIDSQPQGAPPFVVVLDKAWYQTVATLPGTPTAASIILAVKGSVNVTIFDLTTLTAYNWSGTAYTPTNGSNFRSGLAAPTVAAGAAAGSSPTIALAYNSQGSFGTVTLTTGTATTTGTIFTLTWATTNAFTYAPACQVVSTGANAYTTGTISTAYISQAVLTFAEATAPLTASTSYTFAYRCN